MLIGLLNMFKKGQNYSLDEISNILNTDILSVKAKLEYLERLGYIKKVKLQKSCNKTCNGCRGCSERSSFSSMWELTK